MPNPALKRTAAPPLSFAFGAVIRFSLAHVMKRKKTCSIYRCTNPPFLGVLCEMHSKQAEVKARREEDALELLHRCVIDGAVPSDPIIREDFDRLSVWWRRACNSVNNSIPDVILKEEAGAALSWCIGFAQELVDVERAIRSQRPFDKTLLNHTRQLVWERFGNLERGLMSNGIERPK